MHPFFCFRTFSIAHSTFLSLQRPITSSPQGHPLTQNNLLSHNPSLQNGIFPPIPVCGIISFPWFLYSIRTNPSSGADPNITMSRAAICVLTGSARGALWMAAKTIHSHGVPYTPMFFHSFILENSTVHSHSSLLDMLQMFSCSLEGGEPQCHLKIYNT